MHPTAIGVWIKDGLFVSKGAPFDNISIENINEVKTSLLGIITSKFKYTFNITIYNEESDTTNGSINALVCTSDIGKVSYLNKEYIVENKFIILQKDKIDCSIVDGNFKQFSFKYKNGITPYGEGQYTYIVKSLVRDEYEIHIKADSESEAINKANMYDIKDWNHLDIDTEYPDRVLLRAARWGNFKVRKI